MCFIRYTFTKHEVVDHLVNKLHVHPLLIFNQELDDSFDWLGLFKKLQLTQDADEEKFTKKQC